mmetsp:Transcript_132413/g.330208  ORF Transcript_132413/g.330208 Transcript_132413/m.330208 type:complete len:257 (+) Transcript_132413:237-1007(+)
MDRRKRNAPQPAAAPPCLHPLASACHSPASTSPEASEALAAELRRGRNCRPSGHLGDNTWPPPTPTSSTHSELSRQPQPYVEYPGHLFQPSSAPGCRIRNTCCQAVQGPCNRSHPNRRPSPSGPMDLPVAPLAQVSPQTFARGRRGQLQAQLRWAEAIPPKVSASSKQSCCQGGVPPTGLRNYIATLHAGHLTTSAPREAHAAAQPPKRSHTQRAPHYAKAALSLLWARPGHEQRRRARIGNFHHHTRVPSTGCQT